ncbi:hypothetical protein OG943_23180 [Amycolatopsis sp. NBC_00345]|uniref:hypothetical protein n=1 Tax=Amycolatopsis sp. NBC_00345 TaxID=2975955 RepID=UPI002E275A25
MTANSRRYGRWCRDHFGPPPQADPAGASPAPQPPAQPAPVVPDSPEDRKPPAPRKS